MCDRCAELEERIVELEAELLERLDDELRCLVMDALKLSSHQARFIVALYQARSIRPMWEIEEAAKPDPNRDYTSNTGSVVLNKLRRALGFSFITTYRGLGIKLSDEARAYLDALRLAHRAGEMFPDFQPVGPVTSRYGAKINWQDPDVQSEILACRGQALTYTQIADRFGLTRGSVHAGIHRLRRAGVAIP